MKPDSQDRLDGKVVLITGGNAGVGKETAVGLAARGAHVVITSRNQQRGAEAVADIRARSANDAVEVMPLDLASIPSIHNFARDFLARSERLDVLIDNAGLVMGQRTETEDGFETTVRREPPRPLPAHQLAARSVARVGPFPDRGRVVARAQASAPRPRLRRSPVGARLQAVRRVLEVEARQHLLRTRARATPRGQQRHANALHPGFWRVASLAMATWER